MPTTRDFLNAVKVAYDLTSDYQLHKKTGLSKQAISRYVNGHDFLGETSAPRVAELLDLDPAYVFACAQLERVKKPEAVTMWELILDKMRPSPTEAEALKKRWPACILC